MTVLTFLRSAQGRVLRVVIGASLLWAGASEGTLAGVVLMMLGLVPVVTAIANICLLDDMVGALGGLTNHAPGAVRHKS